MIVNDIINGALGLVASVVSVLPTGPLLGLNAKAAALVSDGLFAHLGWFGNYIPIALMVTLAEALVGLWVVLYGIRAVLWLLHAADATGGGDEGGGD